MSLPRWVSRGAAAAALETFAILALAAPCAAQTSAQAGTQEDLPSLEASKAIKAEATASEAQEDNGSTDEAAQANSGTSAQSTAAAAPRPLSWSLGVSGGLSVRDDGPDGSWQSLALSRRIGRGYVRASAMRYHGTLVQSDTALPSDYYIGTLAAGGNFDNWVADGWISLGVQDYGRISTSEGSRESTGAHSSTYYAIGGDFGRVFVLSPTWYVTPTLAGSYAYGKLLRVAPTDTDFTDLETEEPTFSGSLNLRLDHAFGPGKVNYAGLIASRHVSSNGLSEVLLGSLDSSDGTTPTSLESRHLSDGWFELGATSSLQLNPCLHLDVYATRTLGVAAGNITSGGLSLRQAF